MKSTSKKGKIIGDLITKSGDLIHMDHAQSSTPGRPLIFSVKNNTIEIFM